MEDLKFALRRRLEELKPSLFEAIPRNTDIHTSFLMQRRFETNLLRFELQTQQRMSSVNSNPKGSSILLPPKRFTRMNNMRSIMHTKIRHEARDELLLKLHAKLFYLTESKRYHYNSSDLYNRLRHYSDACPTQNGTAGLECPLISFENYLKVVYELRRRPNGCLIAKEWLTPKLFIKLAEHKNGGRVQVRSIMDYVNKKLKIFRIRLELFSYDDIGDGFLTKENLKDYLGKKLHNFLKREDGGTTSMGKKYIYRLKDLHIDCIVGELFFLLDPHRSGKIQETEFLDPGLTFWSNTQQISQKSSWDLNQAFFEENNAIILAFIEMDEDGDERIPVSLFCKKFPFISGKLLPQKHKRRFLDSFINRLVYEYSNPLVDNGKISFKTYLDILFACKHLGPPPDPVYTKAKLNISFSSIVYFFRVLDVDTKGYMDQMDVQLHYRNIQDYVYNNSSDTSTMIPHNHLTSETIEPFLRTQSKIKDILSQIGEFDRITPTKLYKSPVGYKLIECLVDVNVSLKSQKSKSRKQQC